jgi:hypothetical protein
LGAAAAWREKRGRGATRRSARAASRPPSWRAGLRGGRTAARTRSGHAALRASSGT